MPNFEKPSFSHTFTVQTEVNRLRAGKISDHKNTPIPDKSADHLLLATWNIANFGSQEREDPHLRLIAEMLSWFDIVAVQEVKDNLGDIRKVLSFLPGYKVIFSDAGGNDERSLFLYDGEKLSLLEKVGEVNIPPQNYKDIKISGFTTKFNGFDRSPYLASFQTGAVRFLAVSVHNFFGSNESKADMERRSLEAYAVARWADLRRDDKDAYVKDNILVMGDFNLPMVEKGDPVYEALVKRGLELPDHSTKVFSNISNDKQYDQIAFFPGLKSAMRANGVFSFDNFVFPELFESKTPTQFRSFLRYFISDHRPMWVQFGI